MIKFELARSNGGNSDDAVVYFPGQDYVVFNGIQMKLDRVLHANKDWVGCIFGNGLNQNMIHFIERPLTGGMITHTAELFPQGITGVENGTSSSSRRVEEREKQISSMRLTQAAVLLKAVKRASESVNDVVQLIKSFDRQIEQEFSDIDTKHVKLGIVEFIKKHRGAVPFDAMEKTLQMVEDESIEIMHEELDIPPFKRTRH